MIKSFKDLGLSLNTIKATERKGFDKPTAVQIKIIPLIIEGEKDLLVQSQTGTGKTAAFAIPLLEKLEVKKPNQLLILAPTRELAIQLSAEIYSLCGRNRFKIALLYGGQSYSSQEKRLNEGAEIVIGTPGRVVDHIQRNNYSTKEIDYLILDEVDQMLRSGFAENLDVILKMANRRRKTYFFSATIPYKIEALAKVYTKKLQKIIIENKKISDKLTEQLYIEMFTHDKYDNIQKILTYEKNFYGIIFCRTRMKAKSLGERLEKLGFTSGGIHGDLPQDMREQIVGKFRHHKVTILTATDVAARGLDFPEITHIINYSLPDSAENFLHRVGRTGRAGNKGTAITFVTPEDERKFSRMKRELGQDIYRREISFYDKPIEDKKSISTGKVELSEEFVRIFVALGTKNGMDKAKLLEYLQTKSGILTNNLHQLLVSKTFSFVTVKKSDAEVLLEAFKGVKNGKRYMLEVASPSKPKASSKTRTKSKTKKTKENKKLE